jgi:outer membrane protein OmpA-like peptidoglycan-associated protein
MKSLQLFGIALGALALAAPMSAHAEVPAGWYVGGNLNMSFQEEGDSTSAGVTDAIDYDGGWGLSGNAGYAFGNGIRTEAELLYRNADVDGVSGVNATNPGGTIHNKALMGNVLYDFETGTRFTPYVGAGVGGSMVDADNIRTINGRTLDDDRVAFAYQGIAGASVDLDGPWDFTIDYRYFATPDVKFKTDNGTRAETENASHNLMMGIRYVFAEPAAPAPAPAPVPAAPAPKPAVVQPPVVAPVPQSYIVFFDFDKSVLTSEAKGIIASAAQDYKSGKYVRLVVTGHTDTMGTAKYNQKLSERRAKAVKDEFERLGVTSDVIVASGAGKRQLMVPTADQIREAQNRRGEIVLQQK